MNIGIVGQGFVGQQYEGLKQYIKLKHMILLKQVLVNH